MYRTPHLLLLPICIGMLACPTTEPVQPPVYEAPTANLISFTPEDGATGVGIRDCATARFDRAADGFEAVLTDSAGETIPSTVSNEDGTLFEICPDPSFQFSSDYTASVSWSRDRTEGWGFSTLGGTPSGVEVGDQFVMDFETLNIIEPGLLNLLLGSEMGTLPGELLVSLVESSGSAEIDLLGAIFTDPNAEEEPGDDEDTEDGESTEGGGRGGDEWTLEQDLCLPTIQAGELITQPFFMDPYLQYVTDEVSVNFDELNVLLLDVQMDIYFPDADSMNILQAQATVDTRTIGFGDVCSLVSSFGIECTACDDGEIACLTVIAEGPNGTRIFPTLPIEERSFEDIDADPECEDREPPGEGPGGRPGGDEDK